MIDYEDAEKLAIGILGFGGGLLAFLGRGKKKEGEGEIEEEANLTFLQKIISDAEISRDSALKERDAANKEREEVSIRAVENLTALTDIVRRLCYMLASSECPHSESDKRQIMAVIKYRQFDMKEMLIPELMEVFGLHDNEIAQIASGEIPAAVPRPKK